MKKEDIVDKINKLKKFINHTRAKQQKYEIDRERYIKDSNCDIENAEAKIGILTTMLEGGGMHFDLDTSALTKLYSNLLGIKKEKTNENQSH